jgi:2-hydroxy-6-oxonona-2,4-dienedioate hydrolase
LKPINLKVNTQTDLADLDQLAAKYQIPYNNGHMVWRCWGQGAPVVLLHGGSGSWKHWSRNIAALVNDGRQVWVPDMPGFGESTAPAIGQDADVLPEPLAWALQQLLPDQAYDLVAFSFGSMVAAEMALRSPNRVKRLVLMGSPALGINAMRPFKLKPWDHLPEGVAREAIHRHNLAVLMFYNPTRIDDLALAIHSQNLAVDRMKRRRLAYSEYLLVRLKELQCPVFGIWGSEDVLCRANHDAVRQALMQSPYFRTLTFVPDAGHWVQYENARAFNPVLLDALQLM